MKESPAPTSPARPAALAATARAVESAERHELVSQFVAAGELERRRLAESIHDDSIQVIAAMGMRLQMLRRTIRDSDQLGMLADAEKMVQLSIERLRSLVFELHPPGLAQEGLSIALAIAVDVAARDAAAGYRLDDELVSQPPPEASVILFRIAQEALANVREHAQASSVVVTLRECDGGYAVRIADDGCGCDPRLAAVGSTGAGFASMRARAALAGGSVRVDTAPGQGTTVEAWLPESPWLGQARGSA
jgi:signal transduction histidine kinase